jgi:cell division protein FtsI (penicillin-binding protein 3)
MTNVKKDILWRVIVSMIVMFLFAIAIGVFVIRIQFVEGPGLRELSDSLTIRYVEIDAVRGNIYAEDGNLLATSIPKYKVSLDLYLVPKDSFNRGLFQLANKLAHSFPVKSTDEYVRILKFGHVRKVRYLTVARNASYLQLREMKSWPILRMGRFKGGLIEEEETVRKQPLGSLASRTIGAKNANVTGTGLEGTFDSILAGVKGKRLVKKTPGGLIPLNDENEIEPQNGRDIYTTLDVNIQDITQAALIKSLVKHKADHGCVVVMEVKTGKIKAISNLTRTRDSFYAETYNYAIGGNFDPGSTFKIVSALALLKDGLVKPEDSVNIKFGRDSIMGSPIVDAKESHVQRLTFQEVIEHSSNVGISRLVYDHYKSHPKDFINHIKSLHLNEPSGVGIKGEAEPKLPEPGQKSWSGIALPKIAQGYSIEVTPLHILMLYNAIANNGTLMKPMLVNGFGQLGKMEEEYEPQVVEEAICDKNTLAVLRGMLEGVVLRGTASKVLNDLEMKVAGKTGTAQIVSGATGYSKNEYNASFVGYFPADNPMYSCIVVVSKPTSGQYYGSVVAAPVFKEIARKVYSKGIGMQLAVAEQKQLPAAFNGFFEDHKTILKELNLPYNKKGYEIQSLWATGKSTKTQVVVESADLPEDQMPNLIGMGLRDAIAVGENKKLRVIYSGYGKVKSQSPKPGSKISRGVPLQINLGI